MFRICESNYAMSMPDQSCFQIRIPDRAHNANHRFPLFRFVFAAETGPFFPLLLCQTRSNVNIAII